MLELHQLNLLCNFYDIHRKGRNDFAKSWLPIMKLILCKKLIARTFKKKIFDVWLCLNCICNINGSIYCRNVHAIINTKLLQIPSPDSCNFKVWFWALSYQRKLNLYKVTLMYKWAFIQYYIWQRFFANQMKNKLQKKRIFGEHWTKKNQCLAKNKHECHLLLLLVK